MYDKVKIKLIYFRQRQYLENTHKENSDNTLIFLLQFHSSKFLELELPVTKC